jgi:alpha-ketoglutarate-dependent taurine dioxygenase
MRDTEKTETRRLGDWVNMTEERISTWTFEHPEPFGLIVRSDYLGIDLRAIRVNHLKEWIDEHRVVVLRGFAALEGNALPAFCQSLGELLNWEFGAVNDLRMKPDAKNYLYTNREVPFHWDGAFIGRAPHYIFFHCDVAPSPESGGETLFCDTTRLLGLTPPDQQQSWERIVITYTTEKVVHYGGTFTSSMITRNPISGEKVIRFAEPVTDLNPVSLEIEGIPEHAQIEFLEDMHRRLRDDRVCYNHGWLNGDVVIADNHALLHGRRQFDKDTERHIRRVNIL